MGPWFVPVPAPSQGQPPATRWQGPVHFFPPAATPDAPRVPPPAPRPLAPQVVRISDGQVYAMKKVSIAAMSQKEIADTLNEIR